MSNHLVTDSGIGFAMIVDGTDSIPLDGITIAGTGVGLACSGAGLIF